VSCYFGTRRANADPVNFSVILYCSFFVTVCYHTIYASPWIFPPLAFYGFDLLMRMLRYRIKDATLVPFGSQMTLVRIDTSCHI
jgi:ferric-chelate reductase